ncbi:hypothetical protein [Frankia sp. CiP3]|uniref:hypothetical protein n=1 Tax=Frankia sp. CiP3 TaxID=2880971 RepID=UPI001EF65E6F|nr:hypothetical protein [Frankia sp. CiP3]
MSRYVEVHLGALASSSPVRLQVGDVVRFAASGGRVDEGTAVELLGIFTPGLVGADGEVIVPVGPPSAVLFRACEPGEATVEVMTGDPWRSSHIRSVAVAVT